MRLLFFGAKLGLTLTSNYGTLVTEGKRERNMCEDFPCCGHDPQYNPCDGSYTPGLTMDAGDMQDNWYEGDY